MVLPLRFPSYNEPVAVKSKSRKLVPGAGPSLWDLQPQVKPIGGQAQGTRSASSFLDSEDETAETLPEGVFRPPVNWVSDTQEDL